MNKYEEAFNVIETILHLMCGEEREDNYKPSHDEMVNSMEDFKELVERSSLFAGLSATKIRQAFVDDNKEYIKQFCPQVVMNNFDYLRNYYLGVVDKPKEDWEMK